MWQDRWNMIPLVCGGYLSLSTCTLSFYKKWHLIFLEKTAPMVQMRAGVFLYTLPLSQGVVWKWVLDPDCAGHSTVPPCHDGLSESVQVTQAEPVRDLPWHFWIWNQRKKPFSCLQVKIGRCEAVGMGSHVSCHVNCSLREWAGSHTQSQKQGSSPERL